VSYNHKINYNFLNVFVHNEVRAEGLRTGCIECSTDIMWLCTTSFAALIDCELMYWCYFNRMLWLYAVDV